MKLIIEGQDFFVGQDNIKLLSIIDEDVIIHATVKT
jgi:hypothetical protein